MSLNEILTDIIDQSGLSSFGVRVASDNPLSGDEINYQVGDSLPNSYEWVDGLTTSDELDGTCALMIDFDGFDVGYIEDSIKELAPYKPLGSQVVLIGGSGSYQGADDGETVISNAVVLYKF